MCIRDSSWTAPVIVKERPIASGLSSAGSVSTTILVKYQKPAVSLETSLYHNVNIAVTNYHDVTLEVSVT